MIRAISLRVVKPQAETGHCALSVLALKAERPELDYQKLVKSYCEMH